jgi:hypothetical protein
MVVLKLESVMTIVMNFLISDHRLSMGFQNRFYKTWIPQLYTNSSAVSFPATGLTPLSNEL